MPGDTRPWYDYINSSYERKSGPAIYRPSRNAYSGVWVIKDVLERAEYSPDINQYRENIRQAFTQTDITPDNAANVTVNTAGRHDLCSSR